MKKLPKILEREPLIDAIFEVRMAASATSPLGDILPGILFHKLHPTPELRRLPAADVPQPMRAADPELRYAPTQRLDWGEYVVSAGDQSVLVSCKIPYPKWANFKEKILEVMQVINDVEIGGVVERYSIKYVNLIEAPTSLQQISKIDLSIKIGNFETKSENINLRIERIENDTIHLTTVVTGAAVKLYDGRSLLGVIVDIDSIRNLPAISFKEFFSDLRPKLETLRQLNKACFFSCLKDSTIEEMGPIYE